MEAATFLRWKERYFVHVHSRVIYLFEIEPYNIKTICPKMLLPLRQIDACVYVPQERKVY